MFKGGPAEMKTALGWVDYAPGAEDRIAGHLSSLGLEVCPYSIDVDDYRRYVRTAGYEREWSAYYPSNRAEKALEHYLAALLLELGPGDRYIDVGSEASVAPDIYERMFGVEAYRQDRAYAAKLAGRKIGGDAANMPVSAEFATKMALHCSFEHFEGASDIGFIREAERVLRPGGAVCIVPLYVAEEYAIQTDPRIAAFTDVMFETDATVYYAKDWGNRHGRFYDPAHLLSRIAANRGKLLLRVYHIVNAGDVDPSCYVRFALLIRKSRDG
jgi:SAM-dependent methyltransferase